MAYQFDNLLADDILDYAGSFDRWLGSFTRNVHHLLSSVSALHFEELEYSSVFRFASATRQEVRRRIHKDEDEDEDGDEGEHGDDDRSSLRDAAASCLQVPSGREGSSTHKVNAAAQCMAGRPAGWPSRQARFRCLLHLAVAVAAAIAAPQERPIAQAPKFRQWKAV